jgi:hypothetical protein
MFDESVGGEHSVAGHSRIIVPPQNHDVIFYVCS